MKKPFFFLLILLSGSICQLQARQSGYLKFEFNVDTAHVVLDNDVMGVLKIASGDSLRLPIGTHVIELYTPFDKEYLAFPNIRENTTSIISHEFREDNITLRTVQNNFAMADYLNANIIIVTDQNTEILYKGNSEGTGFASFNLPFGRHEFIIKNPDYGSGKLLITPNPARPLTVIQQYKKPSKNFARTYSFIPGLSQFYKKQKLKGSLLLTATGGFLYLGLKNQSRYNEESDYFDELVKQYNSATNETNASFLGDAVEAQQDVVKQIDNKRRFFLSSAILVYAYNIFDAFYSTPKGGYQQPNSLEFYLSGNSDLSMIQTNANIRYNF